MRLASSGEDSAWPKMSATKSIRLVTLIVTMAARSLLFASSSVRRLARLGMTAEIGGADRFIAPQFIRLAAEHNPSGLQHIAVIGDGQSHACILLDQQHRRIAADFRNDPEY